MDQESFEALVAQAVRNLPEEFLARLQNVDIVVEDYPTSGQLSRAGLKYGQTLLGLYEGVPQTRRGRGYGMALPDKISIFQRPIEAQCHSGEEIEVKIGEVVRHEIAHHFGTDERTLRKIENEWRKKK